jgi:hypothetical protein
MASGSGNRGSSSVSAHVAASKKLGRTAAKSARKATINLRQAASAIRQARTNGAG